MREATVRSNQPDFDPLSPTEEEQADMVAGFLAAYDDKPVPALASPAYCHGHRNGRSDRTGIIDDDQRELARRYVETRRQPDGSVRVGPGPKP